MKRLILVAVLAVLCASASAQIPMTHAGLGAPSPGGGNGQSVWNPSDNNAAITLSTTTTTNDTATQNSAGSSFRMVRGTQSYATGTANKKIFTLAVAQVETTDSGWIGGVSDSTLVVASAGVYPGMAAHSFGVQASSVNGAGDYLDGTGFGPSSVCAAGQNFTTGGTLWLAIDFNTGNVWCSTNCTAWIGSGTPDPGAGTGAAYTLTPATYYPAWAGFFYQSSSADIAVLNTRPNLAGCSNIAGFSPWG